VQIIVHARRTTLAILNSRHFAEVDVEVVDPWRES
jgi:hypothetical protein